MHRLSPGKRLALVLGFAVVAEAGVLWVDQAERSNFLFASALDLRAHRLSTVDPAGIAAHRIILFQGSSATGGFHYPRIPGLSDIFNGLLGDQVSYNLGVADGTLLKAMAYYSDAKRFHPRLILWEVSPQEFRVTGTDNTVVYHHWPTLERYVPPRVAATLAKEAPGVLGRAILPLRAAIAPWVRPARHRLLERAQSRLHELLYGREPLLPLDGDDPTSAEAPPDPATAGDEPRLDALAMSEEGGSLLDAFRKMTQDSDARLVAYLVPLHQGDSVYGTVGYARYLSRISSQLEAAGIPFWDYSRLLSHCESCFFDSVHRTEQGNEILARRLFTDLKSKGFL